MRASGAACKTRQARAQRRLLPTRGGAHSAAAGSACVGKPPLPGGGGSAALQLHPSTSPAPSLPLSPSPLTTPAQAANLWGQGVDKLPLWGRYKWVQDNLAQIVGECSCRVWAVQRGDRPQGSFAVGSFPASGAARLHSFPFIHFVPSSPPLPPPSSPTTLTRPAPPVLPPARPAENAHDPFQVSSYLGSSVSGDGVAAAKELKPKEQRELLKDLQVTAAAGGKLPFWWVLSAVYFS